MKKINTANVFIWGLHVGSLVERSDGVYFQYSQKFLNSGLELAPLQMPLKHGAQIYNFNTLNFETFKALPGLVADALPDAFGSRVIEAWALRQKRSRLSPIEQLCYVGTRAMGALEFQPAIDVTTPHGPLQLEQITRWADQVIQKKLNLKGRMDDLSQFLHVSSSAGGMRAKAIVWVNEQANEICALPEQRDSNFEPWLIKFDTPEPGPYGAIEYAYYLMARQSGIQMTESRLHKERGRCHFMTRRFDRQGSKKHHVQSLCAMAHYDFRQPGHYSYEQAFQVMRRLDLRQQDLEQMFYRMVFNIVGRNQDDHTKNISFILKQGHSWQLAPAYDLTYSYNPAGMWASQHQLSLNQKCDNFKLEDFKALAQAHGILNWQAIVRQICEVFRAWPDWARQAGVPNDKIKKIQKTLRHIEA